MSNLCCCRKTRADGQARQQREERAGGRRIYTPSEPTSSAACCGRPRGCKRGRVSMPANSVRPHLQDIELACVRQLVALQESIGLDVVTDGEIGRLNFQDSFGLAVSGFDAAPETLQVHQRRAAGGGALRRWDIPDLAQTGTAGFASAADRGAASPDQQRRACRVQAHQRGRQQAGEGQSDRTGSDLAAFRSSGVEGGLLRYGRVLRRRRRSRAAHGRRSDRSRLPLRPHRCAGFHRLRRSAVARRDAGAR